MDKKVLIIEDDKPVAKAYKDAFEQEGFQVRLAGNGAEGIEEIKEEKPDIILLDMIMPVMSGEEFLSTAIKDGLIEDTPVIVVTNSVSQADMVKRKNYSVAGYFVKSDASFSEILRKVRDKLEV